MRLNLTHFISDHYIRFSMRTCLLPSVALYVFAISIFVSISLRTSIDSVSMGSSQHTSRGTAYDQIILFGDSLIQHSSSQDRGFSLAPALQADTLTFEYSINNNLKEFIRRLDVVNRGFSGYNTDQGLTILPEIIPNPQQVHVRFLIILFGANDSCLKGVTGGQHVPLERFKRNLINMVTHPSVSEQAPNIILVTPPPINEYVAEEMDRLKGIPERRRCAKHTKQYADAVKEVANELGVVSLDLWALFMTHAGWDGQTYPLPGSKGAEPNQFLRMLLHDGLHFTSIAYTLLHQELLRTIEHTWPEQRPDRLSYRFPSWNDRKAWDKLLSSNED